MGGRSHISAVVREPVCPLKGSLAPALCWGFFLPLQQLVAQSFIAARQPVDLDQFVGGCNTPLNALAGVAAASVIYQAMNRELAKELKAAGFPIRVYRVGHRFFSHENFRCPAII